MGREYLLLLLGLLLIFTAVLKLKNITADVFMQHSPAHTDSVLTAEAVSWTEMREVVEAGLYEQEEIKQKLQFLLNRQEQQQEAVEKRLQELANVRLLTARPAAGQFPAAVAAVQRRPQQEVFRLFEQGLSVAEVAAQLELGRGEVELILGWQKAKKQNGTFS